MAIFLAWVTQLTLQHAEQQRASAERILEHHREELHTGLAMARAYIQREMPNTQHRAKSQIKEQMELTWSLLHHTDSSNSHLTVAQRRKIIAEQLRPLRYNHGQGYFFITGLDSIEYLYPPAPELLEGRNMFRLDSMTTSVVTAHDSIARHHGEGFHHYLWSKPNRITNWNHPKTSYVRLYKPLGIIVGTGLYHDDIQGDIQEEVLDQLSKMQYGKDSYFFAGRFDGTSLLGPSRGKNMLHVVDINGVRVVERLIDLAKAGGGFLEYHMPAEAGASNARKLSFVQAIPEWGWYLGLGRGVQDIEASRAVMQAHLRRNFFRAIGLSVLALAGVLVLVAFMVRSFHAPLERDVDTVLAYFRQSGKEFNPIPLDNLRFGEMRDIAQHATTMVADLAEKNKDLENIIYISGHDLRTPLVNISGFSTELARDLDTLQAQLEKSSCPVVAEIKPLVHDDIRSSLSYIHRSAIRMDNLLCGILEYGRAWRIQPKLETLNMEALLADCLQEHKSQIAECGAEVRVDWLPPARGDASLVFQVLDNLVGNAIKYRRPEAPLRLHFTSSPNETQVIYSISDNGIGIPEHARETIFQLFTRLSKRDGPRGDGLGLPLARKLAVTMGGQLWVEPNAEQGTRFCFSLPIS